MPSPKSQSKRVASPPRTVVAEASKSNSSPALPVSGALKAGSGVCVGVTATLKKFGNSPSV